MNGYEDSGEGGAIVNISEHMLSTHDNPHKRSPSSCHDTVLGCLAALCFVIFIVCELFPFGDLSL